MTQSSEVLAGFSELQLPTTACQVMRSNGWWRKIQVNFYLNFNLDELTRSKLVCESIRLNLVWFFLRVPWSLLEFTDLC